MKVGSEYVSQSCESVPMSFPALLNWDYAHDDERLRRLYEKAKRSQWNVTSDIDWSVDVDPTHVDQDQVEHLIRTPRSPFAGMDEAALGELAWEQAAWTISQFLHGEQGALMATAKIVDSVPDNDAKLYAATQVMDEARHVEVYDRYLTEKVGRVYPINRSLEALIHDLLADSRWDITYLGMQIMIESLALAAFGFIYQTTKEPLLRDITFHVMSDEARHVAFGIASLDQLYQNMSETERRDREEFVCAAAELMRDRLLMREVFERMDLPVDACVDFMREHPLQVQFRTLLFSKVVPNVKRIGLLTPNVRRQFERLGILEYEDLPASA
jgi:P-aminobenzoate N-oxygenase AurF